MPIMAIDALVVGISLIERKTSAYVSNFSFCNLFDSEPFRLRDVKQSEQYRSFPGIGMNGTVAVSPQEVQSALYLYVRDLLYCERCDVLIFIACMNARTPRAY